MDCAQVTIGDTTAGKKYDCINGICVESAGGQYNEPTCAGACKKKEGDDTSTYLIIGAGVLALALLFGGKK